MNSELAKRIGFTIAALLVFRLGTFIPLPGIDHSAWAALFRSQSSSVLGLANTFSGGALQRMAIFALGVTPYLTAAIMLQLAAIPVRPLRRLLQQGERGRKRMLAFTLIATCLFAISQSYAIALAFETIPRLVPEPGTMFRLTTVLGMTLGTFALIWLANAITAHGFGNGLSLILLLGVIGELPAGLANLIELNRQGAISGNFMLLVCALIVALIVIVVSVERARRFYAVGYPAGNAGIALKLNIAGSIPPLLAAWLLTLALWIAVLIGYGANSGFGRALTYGQPLYFVFLAVGIVLFCFVYTAFVFNPEAVAAELQQYGGAIEGVPPGEETADFIDRSVSRLTLFGGGYLALICLIPDLLITFAKVPFYLSGISLLVVVCAILDLEHNFRAFRE